jgi:hypothetical protein
LGDISTWSTWLAILKSAFALPLDDEEHAIFASVAGNRNLPKQRVRELWCIIGRRGGKSRVAAALAIYFALFVKHKLSAGEKAMVLVLAATIEQAQVVFGYVEAFLNSSPALRKEIASTTRNEIRLRNGLSIAIHANSFRSIRGRTLCAAIFDEVAYWRDDTTATPDTEVYSAVLPALLTTNGMLVGISSPYRRVGLMHAKHKQHFGTDSDTLVIQGPTLAFNKTLDPVAIAAQSQADPTAARSEWDAEFRADISTFLDDNLIDAAIDRARPLELPPQPNLYYRAFVDVSAGAVAGDAYAIAIGHRAEGRYVIDCIRGRQGPFDPVELTKEYAARCKQYKVTSVTGDKYALEWVTSAWRTAGIRYIRSELTASELYLESLPLWTRSQVAIPDHPTLVRELRLLERSPARLAREQVSHPRGVHDDYANVTCGVLCGLATYLGAASYHDAIARATKDDVATAELNGWEQERKQRHDDLLARYYAPVCMTARVDVPEGMRADVDKARASVVKREGS